jgi:hypothetical protein
VGGSANNHADVKAAMAAAYAAGERPEFVSVMPDGFNEVWSLAGVALVVPIVDPDAPDRLQYALRLRRDTLMSGACPLCGATVDVQAVEQFDGVPAGTAFFPHTKRCPAEDSNVHRQVQEHLASRDVRSVRDWFDEANRQTRQRIAAWKENSNEIVTDEGRSRAEEILAAEFGPVLIPESGVTVCQHLGRSPAQTWICLIGEGRWRCEQCWEYRAAEIAKGMQRGEPGPLNWVQDHTCDLCEKIFVDGLQPLLLRINHFVMHGAACRRCSERHQDSSTGHTERSGGGTLESPVPGTSQDPEQEDER